MGKLRFTVLGSACLLSLAIVTAAWLLRPTPAPLLPSERAEIQQAIAWSEVVLGVYDEALKQEDLPPEAEKEIREQRAEVFEERARLQKQLKR